jgi:hypothetical protein
MQKDTITSVKWFQNNSMGANSEKFQAVILGRQGGISAPLSFQDNEIISSNFIKVLGITLDDKLNFDIHVTNICRQAARQINALKRLCKYLNTDRRLLVYRSFISSNFSYCPVTWIFCGKKNGQKLEKIQERALRFVFSDSSTSYDALLKRANILPLSLHRLRFLAIEIYKCVNGSNPSYLNNLFSKRTIEYSFRDPNRLLQPKFNTIRYGFKSFRYYGSKLWNSLPTNIKESPSLSAFKNLVTECCLSKAALDMFIVHRWVCCAGRWVS